METTGVDGVLAAAFAERRDRASKKPLISAVVGAATNTGGSGLTEAHGVAPPAGVVARPSRRSGSPAGVFTKRTALRDRFEDPSKAHHDEAVPLVVSDDARSRAPAPRLPLAPCPRGVLAS